jgi:hypothetical protein
MNDIITRTEAAVVKVAGAARSHLLALFTGGKAPEPHAISHLLVPLQRRYKRLQTEAVDAKAEMVENASLVSHFTPEVCAAAYKEICIEWTSEWHPTIAYIRQICARVDAARPERKLQRQMRASYPSNGASRQSWPVDEFGPAPGKPYCRIPQELQNEVWREGMRWMSREADPKDPVRGAYGIVGRCRDWWGIDVFADDCIIPRAVLAECHVTFTRAEWQAFIDDYLVKLRAARAAELAARNAAKPKPLTKMRELLKEELICPQN